MGRKLSFLSLIFGFLMFSVLANAKVSPQQFLKSALEQSSEYKELGFEVKSARLGVDLAYSGYETELTSSWSYTDSEAEQATPVYNSQLSHQYSLGLSKDFVSGTNLSLNWSRTQFKYDLISSSTTSSFADTLSLSIEQDLWRNFFGSDDRASTRSTIENAKIQELKQLESFESFVIEAMTSYWDTFLAKETLSRNLTSRERLKVLTSQVRKKRKVGFANREDLTRVLAEYEDLERTIKQQSYTYLVQLSELNRWLQKPADSDFEFTISENPSPPVKANLSKDFKNRTLLISEKELLTSRLSLEQTRSGVRPELKLSASAGSTDYDASGSQSFSDASSLNSPFYTVGVSFSQPLFSKSNSSDYKIADLDYKRNQVKFDRVRKEQALALNNSFNLYQTNYLIYESSKKSVSLRMRAYKEISKTYRQGRTDIDQIILAYTNLQNAEIAHIKALRDFHIARLNYLSTSDQLLSKELGVDEETAGIQ